MNSPDGQQHLLVTCFSKQSSVGRSRVLFLITGYGAWLKRHRGRKSLRGAPDGVNLKQPRPCSELRSPL